LTSIGTGVVKPKDAGDFPATYGLDRLHVVPERVATAIAGEDEAIGSSLMDTPATDADTVRSTMLTACGELGFDAPEPAVILHATPAATEADATVYVICAVLDPEF
jgi:hypothetical protein